MCRFQSGSNPCMVGQNVCKKLVYLVVQNACSFFCCVRSFENVFVGSEKKLVQMLGTPRNRQGVAGKVRFKCVDFSRVQTVPDFKVLLKFPASNFFFS